MIRFCYWVAGQKCLDGSDISVHMLNLMRNLRPRKITQPPTLFSILISSRQKTRTQQVLIDSACLIFFHSFCLPSEGLGCVYVEIQAICVRDYKSS